MNESLLTNAVPQVDAVQARSDAVQAFIMHHMADSCTLQILPHVTLRLPTWFSLHAVMLVLAGILLTVWLAFVRRRYLRAAVPTGSANLVEFFVLFIRDQIVVPYFGEEDGRRMTPLFCSFFFFIAAMNLLGLIPCLRTATANISVTAGLALVTFCFMVFGAIYRTGLRGFVAGFIPHGVPWPVLLVLVPIEMIGLLVKALALTIRLFANELAGHIVVYSLLGLLVTFGLYALPTLFMAVLIYLLEIFVAFLQAYIFTLLSAIFIGQRYHPAH